jgi:hypothetical protein
MGGTNIFIKLQKMSRYIAKKGHAIAWWLRHYATNRKVVGSRPDEVN